MGTIFNYQGSVGLAATIQEGANKWLLVYNDTASALSNGVPYVLSMQVASGIPYYTPVAPVSNAIGDTVVVIDNSRLGLSTIAAYAWGYVLVSGLTVEAVTTSTIAANDQLKVANGGAAFAAVSTGSTVGGAVLATNTCAIAVVLVDTNKWKVFLLDRIAVIA
jgi:hypothetical protein